MELVQVLLWQQPCRMELRLLAPLRVPLLSRVSRCNMHHLLLCWLAVGWALIMLLLRLKCTLAVLLTWLLLLLQTSTSSYSRSSRKSRRVS